MNSRKLTTFLLYVILILLVGFLAYYLFFIHGIGGGNTASSTPEEATSTVATSTLTITTSTLIDNSTAANYAITAAYPQITGMANTDAQAMINDDIHTTIENEVESFKQSIDGGSPDVASGDQNTFQTSFATTSTSRYPNVISFEIDESSYATGATHPSDDILSLNYNLTDGSKIQFADLFSKGTDYLDIISRYCISVLESQLNQNQDQQNITASSTSNTSTATDTIDSSDTSNSSQTDTIEQGAGPSASNFDTFLITDQGLEIIFQEYQVASYGAGAQRVTIPWSNLSSVLDPKGPIKLQ